MSEKINIENDARISYENTAAVTASEKSIDRKRAKTEKHLLKSELSLNEQLKANTDKALSEADKLSRAAEDREEYKKLIRKQKERKEKEARLEKENERLSAEKEKSEKRQNEIADFLRRESDENQERELRYTSLLAGFSSSSKKQPVLESEAAEEEKTQKADTSSVFSEENVALDAPTNGLNAEISEKKDSEPAEEELVIKIGGKEGVRESVSDMTIRIGAALLTPEVIDEKIKIAEHRHAELCQRAALLAHGVEEEEKRLISAEDERYRAEIDELRERFNELSRRESNCNESLQTFVSAPIYTPIYEDDFLHNEQDCERYVSDFEIEKSVQRNTTDHYLDAALIADFENYKERSSVERASKTLDDVPLFPTPKLRKKERTSDYGEEYLKAEDLKRYAEGYNSQIDEELRDSRYAQYYGDYGRASYEERQQQGYEDEISLAGYREHYTYIDTEPEKTPDVILSPENKFAPVSQSHEDKQLYHSDGLDKFKRAELNDRLLAFSKEERICLKKISRLEAKQKKAQHEENIALIVEKIGVEKELCELSIEALSVAVYADSRSKIAKQKRILEENINRYNLFCDEYESATGRALERLSRSISDDTVAGRIAKPIPNVYYSGHSESSKNSMLEAQNDRARRHHLEESLLYSEYTRYLEDGFKAEYAKDADTEKQKSSKESKVRYATERDILLIGLRNEYNLSMLEAKKDVLIHSFGSDNEKLEEIAAIDKRIAKAKKAMNYSLKIERSDNARFYMLSLVDPFEEKTKKGARRERLDALRTRLDVLLAEREDINERLIALYGGADKKLSKISLSRKAGKIRKKSARATRKRQHQLARIIEKYRAPKRMKNEAYALLNRKIELVALADETKYKLSQRENVGKARAELCKNLRKAERDIKQNNREIKYIIKRIKKYEEHFEDRKTFAKAGIVLALIVTFAVVSAVVFGDDIAAYVKDLISKFGG